MLCLVYNFITRQTKDFLYLIVANFREQKMGCCALTNQSSHGYSLGTELSNTSYKGQRNVTYSWIQYGVDCIRFWENSNIVVSMVVPLISPNERWGLRPNFSILPGTTVLLLSAQFGHKTFVKPLPWEISFPTINSNLAFFCPPYTFVSNLCL